MKTEPLIRFATAWLLTIGAERALPETQAEGSASVESAHRVRGKA